MSIEGNSELQLCLVNAVKNQAPLEVISTLLRNGADAGDLDFLQSLEDIDVHSAQAAAWSQRVRALPLVVTALNWRATMDQAAFDLVDAIDANFDMGEGSMLALAVRHRCDLEIIKLMLTKGRADVGGFCADALEALDEAEEGAWAAAVTGLLLEG
jgi:hypothetical protein